MRKAEVCLSPGLLENYKNRNAVAVVIDVFRATSSICTAFANGVSRLIPVASVDEAYRYKEEEGALVAGERDGVILDFADFGNSPFNFSRERVEGKTVVYTTTNGTKAIMMASDFHAVVIASFLNAAAVSKMLLETDRDVLFLCAGWKSNFNLEDTACAGYIIRTLTDSALYHTKCDSAHAAMDIWSHASVDPRAYLEKSAQRERLRVKGLDDCIDYCLTLNITDVIPVLNNETIIAGRSI